VQRHRFCWPSLAENQWPHDGRKLTCELRDNDQLTLSDIRKRWCDNSPAYVTAILAQLPDVTHRSRPITLSYSPDGGKRERS
jgi:hypothetical protein